MNEASGIADIATGAIIARELDQAGEGVSGSHHGSDGAGGVCADCGTVRVGVFCHVCGQSGHVHRHFATLGHDIAHGVFHFEGKIWKTLPLLALHPGDLTRRYVHGQRTRFVSPMALFLFSVFLLFAAVNRVSTEGVTGVGKGMMTAKEEIRADSAKAAMKASVLRQQRSAQLAANPKVDVQRLIMVLRTLPSRRRP